MYEPKHATGNPFRERLTGDGMNCGHQTLDDAKSVINNLQN